MAYVRNEDAIKIIAEGGIVVFVDEAKIECVGSFVTTAELSDTERLALIMRHPNGVVCAALPVEKLEALKHPLSVSSRIFLNQPSEIENVEFENNNLTNKDYYEKPRDLESAGYYF